MKIKILFVLFVLFSFSQTRSRAQCAVEPLLAAASVVLAKSEFQLTRAVEVSLKIEASVFGASWEKKNAEAAVVTVFVNGKYNQDVVLFVGETALLAEKPVSHDYSISIGELGAGKHQIAVVENKFLSASQVKYAVIHSLAPGFRSHVDYKMLEKALPTSREHTSRQDFELNLLAAQNAPFIYARPDTIGKFSDIPLLTYYEIFDEPDNSFRIRYTTIFSHEDGGTNATALMARWGRVTDIEWVYEIKVRDGKILSEIYQGAKHETKNFMGKRAFGSHPLLFNVTVNNNFADAGCSAMRFAPSPIRADLSAGSRETVMDKHAWIYRVMAQEVIRENLVNPNSLGANIIDDPRHYLYVETFSESDNTKVSLELIDAENRKSLSDWNDDRLRVDRAGHFRIAVRLPIATSAPATISLKCHDNPAVSGGGACLNAQITKIIRLNGQFEPVEIKFENRPAANLKPGETVVYNIKN